MKLNKLSISNFIGDLPRIFNENFSELQLILDNIIDNSNSDSATHSLAAKSIEVTGNINANTISATNIILKINGKKYSLVDLIARIETLEDKSKI